jgi:hypothetical protein
MPNDKGKTVEDLKNLKEQLGPEGPGAGAENLGGIPDDVSPEDIAVTPQELADGIIAYANEELSGLGLKPLNVVQKLLLRMSIVGFSKKHDIQKFDIQTYPEIGLVVSVAWIAITKVREYRELHPKQQPEEKKTEPAPAPEKETAAA